MTARTPLGRDGRPLITTAQAAYTLGKPTAAAFRAWARRHSITHAARRPTGGPGHPEALWDLADITDAIRRQHDAA
ncbi:hypothetical protein [Streptomyces sp. DH37]|uniref:hypothetical protein n=1 Tax=Streptomyces sp. DH37 TaxID=3040122 RepID=UPI0024411E6B|nr:hypothetical protein [Streptomyces sp. DH37]MDG9703790.1 hypothetical protein [Streptomyces sp. DH37]